MNRIGIVFSLFAILFFGTFSSTALASVNEHANENSGRAPVVVPDRYVVVLEDGFSPQEVAKGHGISAQHIYKKALNGFAGHISPVSLEKLKQDSRVKYVEQDKIYTIAAQDFPTGMDRIDLETNDIANVDGVDERVNVVIAVIDTGVDLDHPDLNVDVDYGYDCSSGILCFEGSGYGDDDHNHGTHVAGIAGALDNGFGVVGVAPGAKIVPVKVLRADGSGSLSAIIAGIDYVTLKAFYIDVANISIRGPDSVSLKNAVANSISAGVVYVIAAGNDLADANTTSPANVESAITVSAIADFDGIGGGLNDQTVVFSSCTEDTDDSFACFSNYGNKVDIAAPGVSILSTVIGGYGSFSGTSMAAPHVAGAAALVRSQDFSMSPAAVWAELESMAIPQNSADGFIGDPDSYPEPLLNVGGNLSPNPIPAADAGPNQTVYELVLVTLDGSDSSDPNNDPITYLWQQTAGDPVSLNGANTVSPSFTAPDVGPSDDTLTFSLVVTDDGGASSLADTVDINVVDVSSPTGTVHVGDLEYDASNKKNWNGKVWITVHYPGDSGLVDGAQVQGDWYSESNSKIGSSSCLTDGTGICQVNKSTRANSMTFTVTDIVLSGITFEAGDNHDADSDSTGTEITVVKGGNSGDTGGEDPGNGNPSEAECQGIVDQYNQKLANGKKISKKLQSDYDECVTLYPELDP